MPPTPHPAPIPGGARRAARIAVAAGLVAALSAAGPIPLALAADGSTATAADPGVKSAHDKLGSDDADLLAEAKAQRDKTVTMMIATAPGQTEKVAQELDAIKGGSVGRTYDKLGYVRATVPTGKADSAIASATRLSSVHAIDLRDEIPLEEPSLDSGGKSSASAATYPGPGKDTPAKNPYNPSFETGAVDFVKKNPKADGRGVTIGVLDTGVDLASPALQKTTTGERKIVDWVTATDPIVDGDGTWRPMTTSVTGPTFTYGDKTWKAPAGSYGISTFSEAVTNQGEVKDGDADGDVNRDGDKTDDWGVLYDPAAGTVTVDVNDNGDFTDDTPMKPYKEGHQVGRFGTDNPATDIPETQDFVVEIRKGVPMDPLGGDWVGKKSDFVNIGLTAGSHGTHVAGITAANGMLGSKHMNGAAPGAKIVSSRACIFGPGCTNVAMTEGMIDLVANRGVDVVNMSIGGLPPLNDGNNARAELYTRLIDTYGVQLVISGGNSGPGANTIGDPGLADKVLSVGAGVSKETYAANYGSGVANEYQLFNFSSRGPREDGGFTPTVVAPGSAVSPIPAWMPGAPIAEAGWKLPAGYAMYNGTSMASPQAAGSSALLLSAAKQRGIKLTPEKLRTALTSTARHIEGLQAYEEGAGLIDVGDAWKAIKAGATAHDYAVKAPVDTALDQALKTPGFGTGVYDREGGLKAGEKKTYDVTITRTSGPAGSLAHTLRLANNKARTFSILGPKVVDLPLNKPVTVKVQAAPKHAGIKSAILVADDPRTAGVDKQILNTVVVSTPVKHTFTASGSVERNNFKSYFVTVPQGAKSLQVTLGGLKEGKTVFSAISPYGTQAADDDVKTTDIARYADPEPGVWEIEVDARRTSTLLDNPYKLNATVYGASFDPASVTVPEAKVGTPFPASWTVTNKMEAVEGNLKGGALGSSKTARPTIAEGQTQTSTVEVPEGTTSLDVSIGKVSDAGADLDLSVYDAAGKLVGQSADGDSDESVSIANPAAGTYTVEVVGFEAPSGSTAYDYRDAFFSSALGSVKVDESSPVKLGTGDSAKVAADVTVARAVPEGRQLFGEVRLVNTRGTTAGVGGVTIEKVTP
ncbi:S8 family serine peptidase [Streptomyces sp. AC550_RSS872]|uniref:S8 family serine peptidase n=1 Tax=Streptomyces sp. AC550_RSS872 TaxID=2823689 RepID=UPI001C253781|nr:S8 family serine peptidase [Streptomyces sp. AC550_RSS872]